MVVHVQQNKINDIGGLVVIPPADFKFVDIVSLEIANVCKWLINVYGTGKEGASEIYAIEKSGNVEFSNYGIIGDDINMDIDIISDGTSMQMKISNNETFPITTKFKRYMI